MYYEFQPRNFQNFYELLLVESDFDNLTHGYYSCEIELPFGEVIPETIFYYIQQNSEETQKKENKVQLDDPNGVYSAEKIPTPVPLSELQKRIKNHIDQVNNIVLSDQRVFDQGNTE